MKSLGTFPCHLISPHQEQAMLRIIYTQHAVYQLLCLAPENDLVQVKAQLGRDWLQEQDNNIVAINRFFFFEGR